MVTTIKVLVIEDNRIEALQTRHWLASAKDPPFEVECVDTLQAGLERLAHQGTDIVLLDLNLPDSRGLDTFLALHSQAPQIPIVVLTGEYDGSVGPLAVEKGAQDYLVKQEVDAGTLTRVLRHGLARQRAFLEELNKPKQGRISQVIGFIGAKGGVGTTTTALNIALALSLKGKSVILAELRPSYGTLSCHLNRNPQINSRNLLDLSPAEIDSAAVDAVLCQGQSGLRILFGPQQAKESKEIDAKQAEAIIKGLYGAEYIVLDLPNHPSPATQAAVRLCQFVAVIVEREPAAVAAGKVTINQLQAWGVGGDQVGAIVVNRTVFPVTMEFAEIQSGLGCAIVGIVPWAATACLRALKEGSPLVASQPDNDASISLVEIAGKISAGKLSSLRF